MRFNRRGVYSDSPESDNIVRNARPARKIGESFFATGRRNCFREIIEIDSFRARKIRNANCLEVDFELKSENNQEEHVNPKTLSSASRKKIEEMKKRLILPNTQRGWQVVLFLFSPTRWPIGSESFCVNIRIRESRVSKRKAKFG